VSSPTRQILEHLRFLHDAGGWGLALPQASRTGEAASDTSPLVVSSVPGADAGLALSRVRAEIGDCTRCRLCSGRTQIVFGVGHPRARLMFVGEAPGQEEDLRGEPFVGRAGQLLDKMIASIGMRREEVYIANVVKCRPPDNRNPQPDEMDTCLPFLTGQIEAIRPAVLVALGKIAASALLREEIAITRERGRMRAFLGIPLMPTFHPAYLLRQYTPENRRAVYEDLLQVKAVLEQGAG
jgi:DNA polymerase